MYRWVCALRVLGVPWTGEDGCTVIGGLTANAIRLSRDVRLKVLARREARYPSWLFPQDLGEWKLAEGNSPLPWQAYDIARA